MPIGVAPADEDGDGFIVQWTATPVHSELTFDHVC
jgi:hypothetical protein